MSFSNCSLNCCRSSFVSISIAAIEFHLSLEDKPTSKNDQYTPILSESDMHFLPFDMKYKLLLRGHNL
jgi:hypothetical protein